MVACPVLSGSAQRDSRKIVLLLYSKCVQIYNIINVPIRLEVEEKDELLLRHTEEVEESCHQLDRHMKMLRRMIKSELVILFPENQF